MALPVRLYGSDGTTEISVLTDSAGRLVVTSSSSAPDTVQGAVTPADAAALGTTSVRGYALGGLYNGTTVDMAREVVNALNSVGTGIAASGLVAQFDDVSSQTVTENSFGNVRMSANGVLYSAIANVSGTSFVALGTPGDAQGLGTAQHLSSRDAIMALNAAGTWDRVRTVPGAANSTATGVAAFGLPLWSTTDLTRVLVNTAASGDTSLVSAVASQTIRGHRLRISVAGATVVKLTDGASGTVLEKWNFAGNGGAVFYDLSDRPWFKGTANTALILNNSNAVQVDGVVEYIQSV